MILKTLTLVNFRKFKQITIEFPDGLIGVIGLNGAGKSTIFEAIAWVLYGPVAARTPADQIKRNGSAHSDSCRVELSFIFEQHLYHIVREMKGKTLSPSAVLTCDNKIVATGAGAVTQFIQKLLGMDFKSFFTSIFAKQKELNVLSSMNASERRPFILRMLGIDSLDAVLKDIFVDRKSKLQYVDTLQHQLTDATGRQKKQELQNKRATLKETRKSITAQIEELKKNIQHIKKDSDTAKKTVEEKKKQYEHVQKKYDEMIIQKEAFEERKQIKEKISALQRKIQERQKKITEKSKHLLQYNNLPQEITQSDVQLKEVQRQIEDITKNKANVQAKVTHILREKKDIKSKKTDIQKIGPHAPCPTCERSLEDHYDLLLKRYDKEMFEKQKTIDDCQQQIECITQEMEKQKRKLTAMEKKKQYLLQQQKEYEKNQAIITQIEKEIEKEKQEKKRLQKLFEQRDTLSFDIKEFQTTHRNQNTFFQEYHNALEIFEKKIQDVSNNKILLEKKQGKYKLLDKEIKMIFQKIKEINATQKTIEKEQLQIQRLTLLKEMMNKFRMHLISRIRPALSQYASDFFRDLTDGKYQEMMLDEQYNIQIVDEGTPYAIERFSGGEIDLANLCLRLGISEIITEGAGGIFNFIILDEIFGSQDAIRQQNIILSLHQLSSKFRQIFLITHVEEMKHHMQYVLSVEEKNGLSKVLVE